MKCYLRGKFFFLKRPKLKIICNFVIEIKTKYNSLGNFVGFNLQALSDITCRFYWICLAII